MIPLIAKNYSFTKMAVSKKRFDFSTLLLISEYSTNGTTIIEANLFKNLLGNIFKRIRAGF